MPYNYSKFFPEKSWSRQSAFSCKAQPGEEKTRNFDECHHKTHSGISLGETLGYFLQADSL